MDFIKPILKPFLLILASMALGHVFRPLLLTEEAGKLAFVFLMILLVMTAVREAEKHEPIHPRTRWLLTPLRHKLVFPVAMIYGASWVYAHTTLSGFVADLLEALLQG